MGKFVKERFPRPRSYDAVQPNRCPRPLHGLFWFDPWECDAFAQERQ
jgi:hypothetical protein